jgi:hypothetical protein
VETNLIVGRTYFFEEANGKDYVGRLVFIHGPLTFAVSNASWVAVAGRLSVFMREGRAEGMEIEPVGNVPIMHCTGVREWNHELFPEAV